MKYCSDISVKLFYDQIHIEILALGKSGCLYVMHVGLFQLDERLKRRKRKTLLWVRENFQACLLSHHGINIFLHLNSNWHHNSRILSLLAFETEAYYVSVFWIWTRIMALTLWVSCLWVYDLDVPASIFIVDWIITTNVHIFRSVFIYITQFYLVLFFFLENSASHKWGKKKKKIENLLEFNLNLQILCFLSFLMSLLK